MRTRTLAVFACVAGAIFGCSDDDPMSPVSAVEIRLPMDSLFYGRSVRAAAVAIGDSATVEHAEFEWASSDTSIAVFDASGNILGVGVGTAMITARFEDREASFALRVVMQRADGGVSFEKGSFQISGQCAIATGGRVYCRRLTNVADSLQLFTPLPGGDGVAFTELHTALDSRCGLATTGAIHCWGRNGHWSFGTSRSIPTDTGPVAVITPLRFSTMTNAGHSAICAVNRADDVLYCWGHNDGNQLGREPTVGSDSVPAPVTGALKAKAVSGSNFQACALDLAGAAWCWAGTATALGIDQTTTQIRTPQPVMGGLTFTSITTSDAHRCAITTAGDAYCWGNNANGELGIGTTTPAPSAAPQQVLGGLKFKSISSSASITGVSVNGTCGITTSDDLYCWGAFTPAAIHDRIGARANTPFQIAPGVKFRALTRYFENVCGITTAGHAVCW